MGIKPPDQLYRIDRVEVFKLFREPEPKVIEKIVEVQVPIHVVDQKKVNELTEINRRLEQDLVSKRLEIQTLLNQQPIKPKEIIREVEKPILVETIKEKVVSRTPSWVWAACAALSAASYLLGKVF